MSAVAMSAQETKPVVVFYRCGSWVGVRGVHSSLSLAGAATSIIFVATKLLRDKHVFVTTKHVICRDKICLLRLNYYSIICRDKKYTCGSFRQ